MKSAKNYWVFDYEYSEDDFGLTRNRRHRLKRLFRLSVGQYRQIYENQNGRCAICGRKEADNHGRPLGVDHNHKTGDIRGLLCVGCNSVLGYVNDDINILKACIQYLKRKPIPRWIDKFGACL